MTYADVDIPREEMADEETADEKMADEKMADQETADHESRLAAARRVADAILFEGYILYPYRATSAKNQLRWQFGMLGPIGAAEAGAGEEPGMRATLLIEADDEPTLDLTLRFLHPQFRSVERATESGFEPVDALTIADARWVPWHEAVVCEVPLTAITSDTVIPIEIAGGHEIEPLHDAGRLVRTRECLRGQVRVTWRALDANQPLIAADIEVTNLARWDHSTATATATATATPRTAARDLAARISFAGAHLIARVRGGRFLSLTDPPSWLPREATPDQHRCWPVLLGAEGGPDDLVLISPIILSDRPAVAPESPGDFFDATEIDEMLALRVRTLTDDEKAQARGTDPRAAEIVDRCDTMTDETLATLHGTVRDPADRPSHPADRPSHLADRASHLAGTTSAFAEPRSIFDTADTPWWDPEADASVAPETDTVPVAGVPIGKGSAVRLHPLRRADAQDMFLAGRSATVAAVLRDVDGATHVAVTLDDDPGHDLHAWYGRYHYFAPEELEPLP